MRLGVIGGMGPMASAYFLELMASMVDAQRDQDHPEIIAMSIPSIPDRTAYLSGQNQVSPFPAMALIGASLKMMGADILAIPCMTAHCFYSQLQEKIGLPIIHGVQCCVDQLYCAGVKKVGLLATQGTVQSRLFQYPVAASGMELLLPDAQAQGLVMNMIYDRIKAGIQPDITLFHTVCRHLFDRGAETIILGCTELSLLRKNHDLGNGILDALEVLAKASVLACGKAVKPKYKSLFQPIR